MSAFILSGWGATAIELRRVLSMLWIQRGMVAIFASCREIRSEDVQIDRVQSESVTIDNQ